MEFKQIKELIAMVEKGRVDRIRVKEKDGFELEVERKPEMHHAPVVSYPTFEPPHKFHAHGTPPYKGHLPEESLSSEKPMDGKFITAPLVGTLYQAPSSDDSPFVKVGDRVDENTVVCIIEAMKVMNEVKAGVSGTIAEILVSNGHPVEFGTKLIRIV